MLALLTLLLTIIDIYVFVLLAYVVMSWLTAFNVVNTRNRFVAMVYDMLERLTAPVLGAVRRVIPPLGGLDLSPVIVALLLNPFLKMLLIEYWPR